jgi:glycosyltransferase involved in cell wall biosynthesis
MTSVLHVGAGFRPFRKGGLIAYVEDLMQAQVRRGDRVSYAFSGRFLPGLTAPRVRRRQHSGVDHFEVLNSPLYDHGRQPVQELDEPRMEAILERVLAEVRPDVVHVQELAGWPSSVLDVLHRRRIPTVMSLHDYFLLCPTFRLLGSERQSCVACVPGSCCVQAMASDSRPATLLYAATVTHELRQRLPLRLTDRQRSSLLRRGTRLGVALAGTRLASEAPVADSYRRRAAVNVDRLGRVDALLAVSHRVAELYRQRGVAGERLQVMHITLSHIERLAPRQVIPSGVVTFGSLSAGESISKGSELVLEAARRVAARHPNGFRLLLRGRAAPEVRRAAAEISEIEVAGPYVPDELDAVLDPIDVGLLPPIWEEAYGLAGIEFLAKGTPVLANAVGGIVDYVRDGENGWLNHSCTAEELAELMSAIIRDPGQVTARSATACAARDALVTPLAVHADKLDMVYAGARR